MYKVRLNYSTVLHAYKHRTKKDRTFMTSHLYRCKGVIMIPSNFFHLLYFYEKDFSHISESFQQLYIPEKKGPDHMHNKHTSIKKAEGSQTIFFPI